MGLNVPSNASPCAAAPETFSSTKPLKPEPTFSSPEKWATTVISGTKRNLDSVLGHYQSEQYTIQLLCDILSQSLPSLPLFLTEVNTNPIQYL